MTFTVVHQFIHGAWTYRPGEGSTPDTPTWTREELEERGFTEADIAWWKRRGTLEETAAEASVVADPIPEVALPVLAPDED